MNRRRSPRHNARHVARPVLLAAALAVTSTVAACSTGGSNTATSTTLSTGAPSTSTSPTTTATTAAGSTAPEPRVDVPIPGPAPSPDERDVPDRALPGLGDPRIDVHHYDVTLRADPGAATISGRVVLTLSARTTEPLRSFTLDLRGPKVRKVTVDGTPATHETEGDQVSITPEEPLEPDDPVQVAVDYGGRPEPGSLLGLGIRTGLRHDEDGGWFAMSQPEGTRTWVPVNDHPSDKATWRITLDTPVEVVGVSNGRLVSNDVASSPGLGGSEKGERRHWVWEVDRPMATYLAVVAIGDYDLVESTGPAGAKVLEAFTHELSKSERARFDDLDEIVTRFSREFGPYPDDDLGVLVVPSSLGVALETQTRPLFGTDSFSTDLRSVLAHELAHQWWGDAVTPRTWADLWLSEGFATYSQWLDAEQTGGTSVRDQAESTGGTDHAVTSVEAVAGVGRALYDGGATALQALRDEVGAKEFTKVLRAWLRRYDGSTATTADFVALASRTTGRDLSRWARTWLYEPQPAYHGK
ncbi:MAG: M1 family metallopeptidase [Acidimicrobiales bacterium]|nr:M1 family metallopeptidase [Acidimicrobiales bacterium]